MHFYIAVWTFYRVASLENGDGTIKQRQQSDGFIFIFIFIFVY